MAAKNTKLSITLSTVDRATAGIKAISARLDAITKPTRDFGKALSELRDKSGLNDVIAGFKGLGSALAGVLAKVGILGGVAAGAFMGVKSMIDQFDDLGDKAEQIGVGIDWLSQMEYAAQKSGASVEQLDAGLQGFTTSIGKARAGTGRMLAFLKDVSPELARQVKGAKSNEAALDLVADAASKLGDKAKLAALAQATLGDAKLAPMLAKGAKGLRELRDRAAELAPGQAEAAAAAGTFGDSMDDMNKAVDGVKAKLVTGLAPALGIIVDKLTKWFTENQGRIGKWATEIGEKLPGAVEKVVDWIGKAVDKITTFVDSVGGLKNVAIAAGLILAGPLISAVVSLGSALVTTTTAMSGLVKSAAGLGGVTGKVGTLAGAVGGVALPIAGAMAINELTGGSFEDQARAKGFKGKDGDLFGSLKHLYDSSRAGGGGVSKIAGDLASRHRALSEQRPDVSGQSRDVLKTADMQAKALELAAASPNRREAKVSIDVKAPAGTRGSIDPKSTADVDMTMTNQMIPAF